MCTLPVRMNSGVGSTGSMDTHAMAADAPESALEMILNGVSVRLALPSREWSSIVSND
jgi:hypothetical protein